MDRETSNQTTMTGVGFERGYVQLYTGEGKGKTTAAIGLAVRAAGAGLRVFFAQFIKKGSYSEIQALEHLGERIVCRQYGQGRWIRGEASGADIALGRQGLEEIRRVVGSSEFQVVILDEALMANWLGMVGVEDLIDLIENKPPDVELVLTGRGADPRLVERADLVTEMREIKHYYRKGVRARKGIES